MAIQYWIRKGTDVQGPFDQLQVRGLVALGALTSSMEISTNQSVWHLAGKVKGLIVLPAPASVSSSEREPDSPSTHDETISAAAAANRKSDEQQKRQAAFDYLESKGIRRSSYAPPAFRLLWRRGVNVPPPHFASYTFNAVSMGVTFGVLWGLFMWLMHWLHQGVSIPMALISTTFAGVAFGLAMAFYYRLSARKHGVPSWSEFAANEFRNDAPAASSAQPMSEANRVTRHKWRWIVAILLLLVVGVGGALISLRYDSGPGCSDPSVTDLARAIIYEDMAKRSMSVQLVAAAGQPVTEADLKRIEGHFRQAVRLTLSGVSTFGKHNAVTTCRATLHMVIQSQPLADSLSYLGETYSDGEELSYSVRMSDDEGQFYVRIPAE